MGRPIVGDSAAARRAKAWTPRSINCRETCRPPALPSQPRISSACLACRNEGLVNDWEMEAVIYQDRLPLAACSGRGTFEDACRWLDLDGDSEPAWWRPSIPLPPRALRAMGIVALEVGRQTQIWLGRGAPGLGAVLRMETEVDVRDARVSSRDRRALAACLGHPRYRSASGGRLVGTRQRAGFEPTPDRSRTPDMLCVGQVLPRFRFVMLPLPPGPWSSSVNVRATLIVEPSEHAPSWTR
jgi:hypothetical protein